MAKMILRMMAGLPMVLLLSVIGVESFADTELRHLAIYTNFRALTDVAPSESALFYVAPTAPRPAPAEGPGNPRLGARVYDQAGNVLGDIRPVEVANGGFQVWEIEYACDSSGACEVYVDNRDGSGPQLLPGRAQIVGGRPIVLLRLACVLPCRARDISTLVVVQDPGGQTVSTHGEELLVMKELDIVGVVEGDPN